MIDWQSLNEEIVVRPQQALAVYLNKRGQVVIAQQSDDQNEEDQVVIFDVEHVPAIIEALMQHAGFSHAALDHEFWHNRQKKGDPTAAERQRRRRDKHRDKTVTVTPVTAEQRDMLDG